MANRTNIHERIHVSCRVGKLIVWFHLCADYISILSKLRQNIADIQWIRMDYHDKMLFL